MKKIGLKKLYMKHNFELKKYPKMKAKTKEYLQEVFQDDIEKLEKLIGKDLSMWKH